MPTMKSALRQTTLLAIAALFSSTLAIAAETPTSQAGLAVRPIVLKAAHIFDAVSGKVLNNGVVIVSGKKIQAAGSGIDYPDGGQIIDLGDATLMPGFIDAHVHLSNESSGKFYNDWFDGMMRFPAEQALYGARYAKATLEAGVTTVRDVGSSDHVSLGLRNAIDAGVVPGPRMLIANNGISATGGHGDGDPIPPERVKPLGPLEGVCNGPEECRAAVRYQMKYGADVIKFMPSGGVLSLADPVDVPELTQDEMNAIVSEAHAWKRKVAAHCHGDKAAKMAIKAGVDSIEHGTFLEDDTLEMMKEHHVYLVATLFAGDWVGAKADSFPPVIANKARGLIVQMKKMFRRAVEIGVPIAMGTDAGVEPHGMNAREFILMSGSGMSPAQALMAGTAGGSKLLGVDDVTGTLEAGKFADVIALPGDPTQNIEATQHPVLVMKEGVVYVSPH